MSTFLVTGTSGFIGRALAESLAAGHEVVCLSRKKTPLALPTAHTLQGDFANPGDLSLLDPYDIEAVIHLAAVTSGHPEEVQLSVNVVGTWLLMRYLVGRGCRKFVMTSSIAAVGMQNPEFKALQLPIPDEHPCLDKDGYGFSKYMMEELTRYCSRRNPELDILDLRLSSVVPDEQGLSLVDSSKRGEWLCGAATKMVLSDAVRLFTMAVEAPYRPGLRIMNACGPLACVSEPTATVLRAWMGPEVDLSYYEQPGHEYDSVYDPTRIREELGFTPEVLPQIG